LVSRCRPLEPEQGAKPGGELKVLRRKGCASIAALLLLLAAPPATPHATQLSSAQLHLEGYSVRGRLELNARDLDAALGTRLAAGNEVSDEALAAQAQRIAGYVLARARLLGAAGSGCAGRALQLAAKGDHVVVEAAWSCPPVTGRLTYEATLFHDIDPAARHMLTVAGDVRRMALLGVANPRAELAHARAALGEVLLHYLMAGIEHIVIGYDHLAFLLAVIAWGRTAWPLVGVVTAFTVAHSLTLTLAVLGLVHVPSGLVELAIALSVVYVAAENFVVRDLRWRAWIAFAFGLIHGLGFASVLRDYGLPREALVPALAAFNAGVELGQLGVVLAALVALRLLERHGTGRTPNPRLVYAISGAVVLLGLIWTVQRIAALI
jgi:hydrogenase/urease accessory protein HupE